MTEKVTLVIYVYNEYLNLKQIMPTIKKEWYDQLIIIDGGSTDGSYEYLKQKGYEIYKQKQPHWAGAYMEAYEHAKGDIIIDFSPDGNSITEKIPELVKKIKDNQFRLLVGPFKNFNTLKSAYISLNNLGFEGLNIYQE